MSGVARVRIGRIRLKSGGEVRLLPREADDRCGEVREIVADALGKFHRSLGGFAFVTWDAAGYTMAKAGTWPESRVPAILVPDYVRELVAERIMELRKT